MENVTDVFSSHFVNKKGGSLKILVEGNISKGQQGSERFNFYFGADLWKTSLPPPLVPLRRNHVSVKSTEIDTCKFNGVEKQKKINQVLKQWTTTFQ